MAIVKKYPARIVNISSYIEGVFTLEMESLDKPFKYKPGQFLHLALDEYDPCGQWPESRCFSIQSAPDEVMIKITYAVKGQFTKRMQKELNPGKLITVKMPYGNLFMQEHSKTDTVFIAGGTGITPFLSLFNHKSFAEYKNPHIYLGFRSYTYNNYLSDLSSLKFCDLKILYEDISGPLDIQNIFTENGINNYYFISGPPVMIKEFKQALVTEGVPERQVLTDDWE